MSDAINSVISSLVNRHSKPDVAPATPQQTSAWILQIPAWAMNEGVLGREFKFKNFYETMAFVNAVAWVAHAEDHHPDLTVSYNRCLVGFSTHSVGGLSENDFICAAKVDQVFQY